MFPASLYTVTINDGAQLIEVAIFKPDLLSMIMKVSVAEKQVHSQSS